MLVGRAVGIDLGTTYSAVACVDEYGKPVVLKNSDGQSTTPSVVYFDPPNFAVGETALQSTITDPDRVVQFIKRFMGQTGYRVSMEGHEYSPQFISALILRKIVQDASMELGGDEITKAVITVPAYFTENQRHATMEAGQMAGLQVLRIINEPTAAALAYGMTRRGRKRTFLVYDLGGGTFDATILTVEDDDLNVLSVGGDHHLGGKDFDDRIMNYVEEQIKENYGITTHIDEDKELEAELRLKAEAAKRQLTGRPSVPITLKVRRLDEDGLDTSLSVPVKIMLTREILQEITADLLHRTEMLLESVFAKAGLDWDQIDDVLCVGGSSRMPMVGEMLQRVSGKKPLLHDPDECVAKGAALQAALLAKVESVPKVSVGHVLSHSLGIAVMRAGRPAIDHIVPSLTRLPLTQSRNGYTTTVDNQTTVQIRVYEGESTDPQSYSKGPIGVFDLDTSPPRPKGQPKITVEFHCDENGRIMAIASDRDTGRQSHTTIALQSSRSGEESSSEAELLAAAIVS
jgi:molecular chaperone DnaK